VRTRWVRGSWLAGWRTGRPVPSCGAATGDRSSRRRAPRFGEITRLPHHFISQAGALFAMDDTRWDYGLKVTGEGEGLVGHAGAVLLRKLADRAGLTAALGSALARKGKFPLVDRGVALVSMAVAIALGAASMNDIALLAHHELVLGAPPSDTTVRRTLELADPRPLDKIARARAAVRAHVWSLICARPGGFPWLAIAGKLLAGWLVIDLDATLITARSDEEGAAPTFKMGSGFHPLGAPVPIPPSRWRCCCGRATPDQIPSQITPRCWPRRSARSPPACALGCWSASTGPAPATS
jgi:hypothetical protein